MATIYYYVEQHIILNQMKHLLNQNYYKVCQSLTKVSGRIKNIQTQGTFPNKQYKCPQVIYKVSHTINLAQNLNKKAKFYFSVDNKPDMGKKLTKDQIFKKTQEQLLNANPDEDPYTYKSKGGSGKYIFGGGVLFLTGIIAYVQYDMRKQDKELIEQNITGLQTVVENKKTHIGGDWNLIDFNGNKFSSKDLQGAYYIIYFGFTKCPDICPATLFKLARVFKYIQAMPESHYLNLKLVFVSLDPERDQPAKIKKYLKNFDAKIIGVTGSSSSDQELRSCMKKFKIYSNKVQLQNKDYSIDHTTIAYLMDDSNQYVSYLNPNLSQKQLGKLLVNEILLSDQKKMKQRQKTQNLNKDKNLQK